MDLPWEFLYDEPNFLAISVMTPVVRYLDLPRQRRPLGIEPPLRILGMVSSPTTPRRWTPIASGRTSIARSAGWSTPGCRAALARGGDPERALQELRTEAFHVFHYIGHGMYDHAVDDGVLLLEARTGAAGR
jgi:hypothetical protein